MMDEYTPSRTGGYRKKTAHAILAFVSLGLLGVNASDPGTSMGFESVAVGAPMSRPTEFFGVGFHAFFPLHAKFTSPHQEAILHRRWRDLNPSFVRVSHEWDWDLDFALRQFELMKETATSIYLTTWGPEDLTEENEISAYGDRVAEMLSNLQDLRRQDHIRWYCMTNELSLPGKWSALSKDLPRFEIYHRAIFRALEQNENPIALLATDASPTWNWKTIEWAQEHMDDVTGAYGGHHYINKHAPGDLGFYDWFRDAVEQVATPSHALGKPFIIGEFGPKQHRGERYGFARWDGCAYFDTPEEPMAALQTAEAVIAAVNGGADAIGYWTFSDFPDEYSADKSYANKWGTFRWDKTFSLRPVYFSIGLLSRFMRGPADVCEVTMPDRVRALAVLDRKTQRHRVALINRRLNAVRIRLETPETAKAEAWSGYIFDPSQASRYCQEDALLNERNVIEMDSGSTVTIPPQSLVVLIQE